MKNLKEKLLTVAEIIDAYRIIPRLLLAWYGYAVIYTYQWYQSIKTFNVTKCDDKVLSVLLDRKFELDKATDIACSVVEVVGGPTTGQSIAISSLLGLATAIFAFYTSSGRQWNGVKYKSFNKQHTETTDSY